MRQKTVREMQQFKCKQDFDGSFNMAPYANKRSARRYSINFGIKGLKVHSKMAL
jgi:hypothetical protein